MELLSNVASKLEDIFDIYILLVQFQPKLSCYVTCLFNFFLVYDIEILKFNDLFEVYLQIKDLVLLTQVSIDLFIKIVNDLQF